MATDGAVVRDAGWDIAAVRGGELNPATGWPTGELSIVLQSAHQEWLVEQLVRTDVDAR